MRVNSAVVTIVNYSALSALLEQCFARIAPGLKSPWLKGHLPASQAGHLGSTLQPPLQRAGATEVAPPTSEAKRWVPRVVPVCGFLESGVFHFPHVLSQLSTAIENCEQNEPLT